jgi:hypothetical protein
VQNAIGGAVTTSTVVTATLAAFGGGSNGTYFTSGFFDTVNDMGATASANAGFTKIRDDGGANKYLPSDFWRADNSTTCTATASGPPSTARAASVAVEIKGAAEDPAIKHARRQLGARPGGM